MSQVRGAMTLAVPLKIISVLPLCLLWQACAQPAPVVSKSPQEDPPRFVRVEARYGDANPAGLTRFHHPLELSEKEWTRLLENVWVVEPGQAGRIGVTITGLHPDKARRSEEHT